MSDPDAAARIGMTACAALDLFVAAVEQIPRQRWDQPSNLDHWSIRELVGHATGSAAKIVALVEDGEVWGRSEPADWMSDDPAARLREMAARLQAALPIADLDVTRASPQGEVPLRRALAYPVSDLALHSWDVFRSQDQLVELPENLLVFCREFAESVPEERLRQPGGFGPAQRVPDDASPTARLMAYLGRSV
jgi:uncharacterized protein (TIGR03086 family)